MSVDAPHRLTPRVAPTARLRPPRTSRLSRWDVGCALATYTVIVTGIWVVHGGIARLADSTESITALTQLTGLWASAAGLLGLFLTARPGPLERRYGLDRLFNWHRVLGETMAVLVGLHVASGVMSWETDGHWMSAIMDLTGREPYFAGATIGAVLIGVVTVTSLRSIRNRLSYETWYFLHLTAYLAFGLSFGHMIVDGTDFADDAVARWIWIGLHVAVALSLLVGRWGRTFVAVLRPLRVAEITRISPDVCTVRVTGRRLRSMRGAAGQFCFVRPLTREGWWHSNPYSLSAAPTVDGLRFTIKHRGDASEHVLGLAVGTRVAIEGPFGVCTPALFDHRRMLFVVGGVGIAPARALLEELPLGSQPIVLYRAHHQRDLLHHDELVELAARCDGEVLTLVGPSATLAIRDPFSSDSLRRAVGDLEDRVAVLCGPDRLVQAARRGLVGAGVSIDDIHYEHAWW